MTWAGLSKKGVMVLRPDEWNTVIDALDILKQELDNLSTSVNDYYNLLLEIKNYTSPPTSIETMTKEVSTIAAPITTTDKQVKRIHISVPSNAGAPVYVGGVASQDYRIDPGGSIALSIGNAKLVYLKSTTSVTVTILFEI